PSSASMAGGAGAAPGRDRVSFAELEPPIALGPLDGRYRAVVAPLVDHLSEAALNRARLDVEVSWLVHLTTTGALPGAPALSDADVAYLRGVVDSFGAEEIAELAEIERETRHDAKAVAYFRQRRPAPALSDADVAYLRGVVDSFGAEEIAELAEIERETRHDVKAVEYFLKRRLAAAAEAVGPESPLPAVGEIVHIFCTSEDVNNLSYAMTIRDAVRQVWLPTALGLVGDLAELESTTAELPMLYRTHVQTATP